MLLHIDKLLEIASPSLIVNVPEAAQNLVETKSIIPQELLNLLRRRNGFFAFEKALHVFGLGDASDATGYDLVSWNCRDLWRGLYGDHVTDFLFFAEDIFGCQFALFDGQVLKFNPETGTSTNMASNLNEWAGIILANYRIETGWPLAHEWQAINGALPSMKRLLPKTLFVLGGKFECSNLYAGDAVEGMRFRADIAQQIRNLPDGAKIRVRTV